MTNSEFVSKWHTCVAERDLAGISEMLAQDIVFHSPAFFKPYKSREPVAFLLSQVIQLLPDLTYVGTYDNDEGGIVLQFVGTLTSEGRDYRVQGVDILTRDKDGRVSEFVVMIRPLSALQALATEMKKRLAGA